MEESKKSAASTNQHVSFRDETRQPQDHRLKTCYNQNIGCQQKATTIYNVTVVRTVAEIQPPASNRTTAVLLPL
jgi:hypothetical protein